MTGQIISLEQGVSTKQYLNEKTAHNSKSLVITSPS